MKLTPPSVTSIPCRTNRSLLIALTLAALAAATISPAVAANAPATKASAEQTRKLPVTATFERVATEDGPPYVLKLTNNSAGDLKVSATVMLSVVSHNRDKAREVPAQVIAPGKSVTIRELAAQDKVVVRADGYAPLELEVKSSADQGRKLPVAATFEKGANQDGPPYVLKLKNTSQSELKVSATVMLSVVSHNRDKTREVPAQVIRPGQTVTIPELAAQDKVVVKADGYAPLELVVKQ